MNHLVKLKPAQVLFLKELGQTNAKDLLKVTFMDLIIKKVLEIKTVQNQIGTREIREYKFVVRGAAFSKYKIAPYEEFYLSPFIKARDLKLLIPNAIKIGFENSAHPKKLIEKVTESLADHSFIKQNFFQKIFGYYSLTSSGKEYRNTIKKELLQLEADLPDLLNRDKTKAIQVIQQLGGSLYLLRGLDMSLINELDIDVLKEFARSPGKTGSSEVASSGCSGCGSWDSGYSNGDGSGCGGSGCGGSGCSGCGGCGGGD